MEGLSKKILIGLPIAIVGLSFALIAYASSYNTSFSFSVSLRGTTRYFDGSNIAFSASIAKSTPFKHRYNTTYNVALYRDNWLFDDYIGSSSLPRDAAGTAKWSSVGKGNYYIYLSKANDGVTLVDNNVRIYNY